MSVRFWDPTRSFRDSEDAIMAVIHDVLAAGDLVMRQQMEQFEHDLAAFVGTADAVGVANCTDGLMLTLEAAGVGPGDEVVTVSHTFMATLGAIHRSGATPVLVDVGDDHLLDVRRLEAAIGPRTRAIMPVHLNGRLCRMDEVCEIAQRHDLLVIEDAAQALGASLDGVRGGAWGLAGVFSFYPAKLLGAYGDAGVVVTSDADLASRLRGLRDHGRVSKTEFSGWGWNSRLDNLQAALLSLKLKSVPEWIQRRRLLAEIYDESLGGLDGLVLPPRPNGHGHFDVFQNYVIESDRRDELVQHLTARGIETLISPGPIPNHLQPVGLDHFRLPRTEELCGRVLSLPMYPELTEQEVLQVTAAVREFHG